MNTGAREWDAETYDAVSDPQFSWGMEVLERLELRGDEAALDAGCGSGRVTAELVERLPGRPRDRRRRLRGDGRQGEGATRRSGRLPGRRPRRAGAGRAGRPRLLDRDLPLDPRPRRALRAGSARRCGRAAGWSPSAAARATSPSTPRRSRPSPGARVRQHLSRHRGDLELRRRPRRPSRACAAAGFAEARCWLEPKPVQPARPLEFTSTVTLGPHPRPAAGGEAPAVRRSRPCRGGRPAGARLRAPQHRGRRRLTTRRVPAP